MQKKCSEPETVGNFHHAGANCLRHPVSFVNGVQKKCSEPETVGNFIMGVHRAQDVPQFPGVDCSESADSLRLSANSCIGVQTA